MHPVVITFGITAFVLLVFGILIKEFKVYNLIAGYNTLPKEKKRNINPERLAHKVGITLYLIAFCTALSGILFHFFITSKTIVLAITTVYSLVCIAAVIAVIASKEVRELDL